MLLIRTRKKVLGALLTTGLYAWMMGAVYITDQQIQNSFMRSSVSGHGEMVHENIIFHDTVFTTNPFVLIPVRKDEKSVLPERGLPNIPSINYPRPNIPAIAARPVALPQENLQQSGEPPPATHERTPDRRYSDPIAFIQSGNESTVPSDGITYYGGEGSHLSSDPKSVKDEPMRVDK